MRYDGFRDFGESEEEGEEGQAEPSTAAHVEEGVTEERRPKEDEGSHREQLKGTKADEEGFALKLAVLQQEK